MISVEKTKQLMDDPNLSDEQAEEIRDYCRMFAEVIFEQWANKRTVSRKAENKKNIPEIKCNKYENKLGRNHGQSKDY